MNDRDLLSLITRIVNKLTIWQRVYKGEVKNLTDPLSKARVLVVIYDLGFITADNGFWCSPSDKNSLSSLKIGDWTNVWFEAGDRDRPRCFGQATAMKDQLPKAYDGSKDTHVLFQDPDGKQKIVYDAKSNTLKVGAGTQSVILGDLFRAYFNTHVHATAAVGPPVPPTVPMPASNLSTKLKVE